MFDCATSSSSESEDEEMILLLAAAAVLLMKKRGKRKRRRMRPQIARNRPHLCFLQEMREEVDARRSNVFHKFVRMDLHHFEQLCAAVTPIIGKRTVLAHDTITPDERLAATLRFLATGESYQTLGLLHDIGRSTLSSIIPETCEAICSALKKYLVVPKTMDEWQAITDGFESKLQFPHCIGSVNGKHISLLRQTCPSTSSSATQKYKSLNMALLIMVDACSRITMFDIFVHDICSDTSVFSKSKIATFLEGDLLSLLGHLQAGDFDLPYVAVGSDDFKPKPYLLKRYSATKALTPAQKEFNDRLLRVSQVAERTFDTLINRFGVLGHPMTLSVEKATTVIRTCIALHNFLTKQNDSLYAQEASRQFPGQWFGGLGKQGGNHCTRHAINVRDMFCHSFSVSDTSFFSEGHTYSANLPTSLILECDETSCLDEGDTVTTTMEEEPPDASCLQEEYAVTASLKEECANTRSPQEYSSTIILKEESTDFQTDYTDASSFKESMDTNSSLGEVTTTISLKEELIDTSSFQDGCLDASSTQGDCIDPPRVKEECSDSICFQEHEHPTTCSCKAKM